MPVADADAMEEKFLKELNARAKEGSVEIHKDQGLAENPMDRIDEKLMAKVFLQCYSIVIVL